MFVQECKQLGGWQEVEVPSSSDPKVSYTVTLPPWERNEEEISCNCPSYEFRGHCRHQLEALNTLCHWSSLDGKEQNKKQKDGHICPECGGLTQTVYYNG